MNNNKFVNFLKNKNTVTALAAIIIVLVLIIGYNIRITQATTPVSIPYARATIQPGTRIDETMISYMSAPSSAIKGEILKSKGSIIGKYTKKDTMIPEGSFFYKASITDSLGDANEELYNKVAEGETLNYITVNMLSSYSNSIVPGNYVDIYAAMQWENKETGVKENQVAKLFSNIKIIDVRTSDGKSVFASSTEARTPYVIYFGLPTEQDMLVKMIHAINAWGSGGNQESTEETDTREIRLTPVPTTAGFNVKDKDEIVPEITSYEMVKEIKEMATDVTEDLDSQTGDNPLPGEEEDKGE